MTFAVSIENCVVSKLVLDEFIGPYSNLPYEGSGPYHFNYNVDKDDGLNIKFKSLVSQESDCGAAISNIMLKLTKSDVTGIKTNTIYLPSIFRFNQFNKELTL